MLNLIASGFSGQPVVKTPEKHIYSHPKFATPIGDLGQSSPISEPQVK